MILPCESLERSAIRQPNEREKLGQSRRSRPTPVARPAQSVSESVLYDDWREEERRFISIYYEVLGTLFTVSAGQLHGASLQRAIFVRRARDLPAEVRIGSARSARRTGTGQGEVSIH